MIRKCIWSQYSLKAPARKPETKQEVRPQPTAALSEKPRPCLGGGGGDTAVCPASSDGQILGCGSRANLAINFQVSANKLSKHLCLYQGREGKRIHECWQFCRIHPEPVLDGHGSQPGRGGARYHSFFFSSMETPPGPRATTRSKPPITDMVWKKSYFRKSCMGL